MRHCTSYATVFTLLLATSTTLAAAPSAEQALKLKPVQDDVQYTTPIETKIEKCTIKAENIDGQTGWVVRDEAGQILRRFVDSNADNVVDMWCYYQDDVEVYRDVDSNHNGKADQSRWINTAGTRWGFDKNEDGRIDTWSVISPEEVTAEVVAAMAQRDSSRFERLVLTKEELAQLGLGEEMTAELGKTIETAANDFKEALKTQQMVTNKTEWASFGAVRPGMVPQGSSGSKKDLVVYENVVAMVSTEGKHGEVLVGTLVKVGDAWRVLDAPKSLDPNRQEMADAGKFFSPAAFSRRPEAGTTTPEGMDGETQKLLTQLEELDKKNPGAAYDAERVKLLEKLASISEGEDRAQWVRQLADMLAAAAQTGDYPKGVDDLKDMYATLSKDKASEDLAGYVKFRYLQSAYNLSFQQPNPDYAKIQTKWVEDLEAFVKEYPNCSLTPEAMLQLGMAQEFAGQEEDAKKWYGELAQKFPKSEIAPKAAGAKRRLESVGQVLAMKSQTTDKSAFDLAQLRGKVVLLHYWATWCKPCQSDMSQIKELLAKYGRNGFVPVGISVDSDPAKLNEFLKQARMPKAWPQLYEPGGIDNSPLANQLGILSLPTMILIGKDGKVANRNIHVSELDAEVKKLLQ